MSLSFIQQHLLSYFKMVHVSSFKNTFEVFQRMGNEEKSANDLTDEITMLNHIIKQYDLEIVEGVDELTTEKVHILINCVNDEIAQRAKFYDKNSIQFYSEIVKDCITSENGHLTETHCLNLSTSVGLTKTAAQNILDDFMKEKWLVAKNCKIFLGMRGIVELEQAIRQCYSQQIKQCPLCRFILLQGHPCSNCGEKYHFACLHKYIKSSKNNLFCLKCNEIFNNLPKSDFPETANNDSVLQESTSRFTSDKKRKKII